MKRTFLRSCCLVLMALWLATMFGCIGFPFGPGPGPGGPGGPGGPVPHGPGPHP